MGRRIITPDDAEVLRSNMMSKMGVGLTDKEQLKVIEVDSYFTKILKYIPAEIISGYVAIDAIFKSIANVSTVFQWIIVGAMTVLTALYIWRLTNEPQKPVAVSQIIISTIAFVVWVFALGGPFAKMDWFQYYYGAILLVMYTLAVPVLVGKKSA
jgi:hypothetical protein